jgi:poly-gamma-glutamate synthesis protein (capsule biosynthesis protein)
MTSRDLTIQFLGDISLNREYTDSSLHDGLTAHAERLSKELDPVDLRIANWEAPIEGTEGFLESRGNILHTDEATVRAFRPFRLDVALLANNHAFDCLRTGLSRTIEYLESAGIAVVGAGNDELEASRPLFLESGGVPLAVLAYVDPSTFPEPSPEQRSLLNILDPDRVLEEVRACAATGRMVLVGLHWGMEYMPRPSPQQRAFARRVVDAGATVVACHHPHRLQGHEQWNRGHIFYSLGNFLFGSVYPGHRWPGSCETTAAATCRIRDRAVTGVEMRPFRLRDLFLTRCDAGRFKSFEKRAARILALPEPRYEARWSKAKAFRHFVARPADFIRINGWKSFGRLRRRHLTEYLHRASQYLRGESRGDHPAKPSATKNLVKSRNRPVYVFRLGQLGDALVALPAAAAIKRGAGDRPLVLITDSPLRGHWVPVEEVFRLTGLFDEILTYTPLISSPLKSIAGLIKPAFRIRSLGGEEIFLLVDPGRSPQQMRRYRLFFERICGLKIIGAEQALAPKNRRDRDGALLESRPEHLRLLGIVEDYYGADAVRDPAVPLEIGESGRGEVDPIWRSIGRTPDAEPVAFGPGSKMPSKRWPLDRFEALGRVLMETRGVFPLIFGGKEDEGLGERLVESWGAGVNLAGKLSIAGSANAMSRCRLYIGNDTGTMHLAAVAGLRCVCLFSSRNPPGMWRPVGSGHVILRKRIDCEGCAAVVCPLGASKCLDLISVEEARQAVEAVLEDNPRNPAHRVLTGGRG